MSKKLPIGSILTIHKDLTGVPEIIQGNLVLCDGSVLNDSESLLNGSTLPNLNGDNRFLRGGLNDSTDTFGAETHNHFVSQGAGWNPAISGSTTAAEFSGYSESATSLPAYIDMVFYIKVK